MLVHINKRDREGERYRERKICKHIRENTTRKISHTQTSLLDERVDVKSSSLVTPLCIATDELTAIGNREVGRGFTRCLLSIEREVEVR